MPLSLAPLPIDPHLPRVIEILRAGKNLVLEAEPGAGKTTRVPRALLDAGLLDRGACWILEPRRLAVRLASARVAEELGEELGGRVGYAVRFEQKVSKATRLRFVTEALLLRRLQDDPELRDVSVVILDEFHERHLESDLALALLRRLQRSTRPDLRIVVMSATLDAESVAIHLDAERLRCEGRCHPVEIRHAPRADRKPLSEQVAEAVGELCASRGHLLVFLPGAADIRACERTCAPIAARTGLEIRALHGSLSLEAQRAAVAASDRPRLILSTNVAESSLTVEGVVAVIDSGLGKEAVHDPWSGLQRLRTQRISQARCIQRTGRAGRMAPGVCVRLYTEAEFQARPPFDAPEILRADFSEASLRLHGLGIQPSELAYLTAPPASALDAAERLLTRLGAVDDHGHVTDTGRRMAALPLHPRLARLVLAAQALGVGDLGCLAAALLEAGDLGLRRALAPRQDTSGHLLDSDLWTRVDAFHAAETLVFMSAALRDAGLDPSILRQVRETYRALGGGKQDDAPPDAEARLLRALLHAYPDRLACSGGASTFAMQGGGGAKLAPESRVKRATLILALEVDQASQGPGRDVLIRMASKIEPEWLLEAFPEALREDDSLVFNTEKGRVERCARIWYEDLCIEERRRSADASDPESAVLLAAAAMEQPPGESLENLLARALFLGRHRPDLDVPPREALQQRLLRQACTGCLSLKELESVDWSGVARMELGAEIATLLERFAPAFVQLPKRRVKVNYGGEAPWIESRLQDFFGMPAGPRVANGAVPLVLHLLAPNARAIQVTTDLAGFWQRAYRELRPQLSRRYPKHAWPENPS